MEYSYYKVLITNNTFLLSIINIGTNNIWDYDVMTYNFTVDVSS